MKPLPVLLDKELFNKVVSKSNLESTKVGRRVSYAQVVREILTAYFKKERINVS